MPTVVTTITDGAGAAIPEVVIVFTAQGRLTPATTEYPSESDVTVQADDEGIATATLQAGRWYARWVSGNAIIKTIAFDVPAGVATYNLTPHGLSVAEEEGP